MTNRVYENPINQYITHLITVITVSIADIRYVYQRFPNMGSGNTLLYNPSPFTAILSYHIYIDVQCFTDNTFISM